MGKNSLFPTPSFNAVNSISKQCLSLLPILQHLRNCQVVVVEVDVATINFVNNCKSGWIEICKKQIAVLYRENLQIKTSSPFPV